MSLALLAAVALALGALVSGGQPNNDATSPSGSRSAASVSQPQCSKASVSMEVERRNLLESTTFSALQDVDCRDVTSDGLEDATFVRMSTGSAGTLGWGILLGQGDGGWALPLFRENEEGIDLAVEDGRVVRRRPIHRPTDPHCCPTGGTEVEVYVYRAGRFEIVEQYSEQADAPETGSPDEPEAKWPRG